MSPHQVAPPPPPTSRSRPQRRLALTLALPVVAGGLGLAVGATGPASAGAPDDPAAVDLGEVRSLDGSGNNPDDPTLGAAGTIYPRTAPARYADDVGEPVDGPSERYLSNRIFNDTNQNIFSEGGVTHWGFVWGQFLDHTFGLRATGDEDLVLDFDPDDPLESFTNDLGAITTTRSAAAEGTGVDSPRQQTNTVSSFIDAWSVYGGSDERLDWLRDGTVDGDPTNNEATLLDEDGYLPTAASRPDDEVPEIDLMGRLMGDPSPAVVAGDVRANENIGLTAVHTLFLREHNRIVEALPDDLDEETRFQIARRVVGALQQHITYTEFLPAMGVDLPGYDGYDPTVDPSITSEFATVGYRAHSQIHGELEAAIERDDITDDEIAALEAGGVEVTVDDDEVEVAVPLNIAFGNPGLLTQLGLGHVLAGLASESAYANDEQIDNQLRSILFQIPSPDAADPMACLDGPELPDCFTVVNDLGALDVARSYDHGMPTYNELRAADGLAPATSFADLTGEDTEELPDGLTIDDPAILDVTYLADADGNELEPGSDAADTDTVVAERRSTTAARLAAVFGDVDSVDAFTGMVSEPHVPGAEMGELQLAMWTRQFTALRDGDRFYYEADPVLDDIATTYGIDARRSLAEVIADNTDVDEGDLPATVFLAADDPANATPADPTDPADPTPDDKTTEPADPADPPPPAEDRDRRPGRRADGTRRPPADRREAPTPPAGEPPRPDRPRPARPPAER